MDRSGSPHARIASWLPHKPWQVAVLALLGLFVTGVIVLAVVAAVLLPTLPPVRDLSEVELKVPLRVYTADGQLIAEFGEEKRIPVKIENVPPRLIQAILSAEDHSFYSHHGVDFLGIARAAWRNFRAGGTSQGASTITMQVARNFFLSPEKTYTRKLREILLAFKIERELSKDEILELYINKIFLGHRAYGFAAAAQIYYGTTLDKLSLAEVALLAGLPKAPSRDNPLTNPQSALERRNYVLRHMHGLGYIDQEALDRAVSAPITASRHALRYEADAPYVAEMVRQYMFEAYDEKTYAGGFHVYTTIDSRHQRAADRALRRALLEYDRRHGYRGPAGHVTLNEPVEADRLDDALKDYRIVGDLVPGVVVATEEQSAAIYTQDGVTVNLDWEALSWARPHVDENTVGAAPKVAAQIVKPGDIVYVEPPEGAQPGAANGGWRLAQIPQVAGALVSLRPRDGAILALAGGFDFYQSSFNRATQAERQPGSSLKPFVYTAALEKGFTPASTVSGAPIVIEDANLEDEWRPENYSRRFFGPTRLRKALALSLNTVSIRLVRAIGPSYAADYLTRFGFARDKLPRNLSLALGNASATPLQMASAFAVYANGGFRVEPYFIARVEDARHNVLEQARPLVACGDCPGSAVGARTPGTARAVPTAGGQESTAAEPPQPAPRVLTPEVNFLMTSMMQDVIREGTGSGAKVLGRRDIAGKTGTTDDYRDAWFSGYNHEVAATAWVGFDQASSLGRGEAGGRTALPMWVDYMRVALEGIAENPVATPDGITKSYVHAETGEPVAAGDPDAIEEYFARGPAAAEGPRTAEAGTAEMPETGAPPVPPPSDNIREKLF
ncbi:peptidase [Sulfurifustis variabilis]|uniref:Penicillin-binding protein 1A n=1 Tax=Sulfurifustis variabilis TaxID=1675686 RepID=A0A1B4UZR2_9GAMM|nr:penicillin-binding protein 1A [Sulfurifustis variabilis]BAU46630.1 peptidase [Sulfurifustis variabilis]